MSRWLAFWLLVPGVVHAGEPSEEDTEGPEDWADRPVSDRPTRGRKHPDCDDRTPLWEHVVAPGEHLGLVAGKYGVRRRDLVELNTQLDDPDLIHPGQRLRVCPEIAPRIVRTVVHRVSRGDTVIGLARNHGMTVDAFLEAQSVPLTDPDHIRIGQELRFTVDGGMVEAFLPPLPQPKRSRSGASVARGGRERVDVKLDAGDLMYIKRPQLAYGTARTVELIEKVVRNYSRTHKGSPQVLIGDISRKGGGQLRSHASHRVGVDVDVGYVLRGSAASRRRFQGVSGDNLDVRRTWGLVKAFLDTHEVVYIFMDYRRQRALYEYAREHGTPAEELDELFQYPRGRSHHHGIVRHWPSHEHHFHVRFKERR